MNNKVILKAVVLTFGAAVLGARADDGSSAMLAGNPTGAAQQVYKYLANRVKQSTKGLVWAHHLGGINDIQMPGDSDPNTTFDITTYKINDSSGQEKYPSIVGARYDDRDKRTTKDANGNFQYVLNADYAKTINDKLIDTWQKYQAIPHISAVPPNPWDSQSGRDSRSGNTYDSDQLSLLLKDDQGNIPTTQVATNFWDGVKTIALALQQLRDAGVPVIFRPFPEFNVSKYYFEHETSTSSFKTLWKQVHDEYVGTYGLNNLIFCWEAWVFGRGNDKQINVDQWYPTDNSTVDLIAGAYYFDNTVTYFDTAGNFAPTGADAQVHDKLVSLAYTNGKPFGAAQWGLNWTQGSGCVGVGSNTKTLNFYNSVKVGQGTASIAAERRTAFVAYWNDQCSTYKQGATSSSNFIADPAVVTSDEFIAVRAMVPVGVDDGWVTSNSTPLFQPAGSPYFLRTGDNANNAAYRSIVAFDTTGWIASIPNGATISSATLRVKLASTYPPPPAVDPLDSPAFGTLTVNFPGSGFIFNSNALESADYGGGFASSAGLKVFKPTSTNRWAEFGLADADLGRIRMTGETQLRIRFTSTSDNNNQYGYNTWYSGDTEAPYLITDRPQLIVTYTP